MKRGLIIYMLIALCYLWGLNAYLQIPSARGLPVFLSSYYPDQERAERILEMEEEKDIPQDLCFYWDGGLDEAANEEYGRKAQVMAGGILGEAFLYDWRMSALPEGDYEGCVIDKETAVELFHTSMAEGNTLSYNGENYIVRKVIPFGQRTLLIRKRNRETIYTRVFVRTKGETTKSSAENLLMAYGLTGTVVEDHGIEGIAFLFLLLLPAAMTANLLGTLWKERKNCENKKGKVWILNGLIMMIVILCGVWVWKNIRLPKEWLPGKWSDFEFWGTKLRELKENLHLFIMLPKTASQAERLLLGGMSVSGGLGAFLIFRSQASHRRERS